MRFGMWNVRNLYRPVSLKTVATEVASYRLDLVGVQVISWDKADTDAGEGFTFSVKKEMKTNYGWDFFYIRES
jgi:hypothetical protein